MITTRYGDDTSDLLTGGKRYLERSTKIYGKYENGQHQKRKKFLNQISG
ncbi:MAG: hypothetical protein Q7U51_03720 [Methanoregula sp.]|nr:hypothetical protein [Methanoregula sp.]